MAVITRKLLEEEMKNGNAKVKAFLEYLLEEHKDSDIFDSILINLDKEFILSSLVHYISKGKCNYQITANNFVSDIKGFFENLNKEYKIKNQLFINKEKIQELNSIIKPEITDLKEGVFKTIIEEGQLKELSETIKKNLEEANIEVIMQEISKVKTSENAYSAKYNKFLSSIAVNLIRLFGVKNQRIIDIKVTDYDTKNESLMLNGCLVKLHSNFAEKINKYISIRKFILSEHNIENCDLFFIKRDGTPFLKEDYNTLLRAMKKDTGGVSGEPLAYSAIIRMVQVGLDLLSIENFTGHSDKTITSLQEYYNKDILQIDNLDISNKINLINGLDVEESINPPTMKCGSCERTFSTNIKNWIVAMYEDESDKYIICKRCGENDE